MFKAILLGVTLLLAPQAAQQKYLGPENLGPFSTELNVSARQLFQRLGSPAARGSEFEPYCYASRDGKAFLYVETEHSEPSRIVAVFLSDFPNCLHRRVKSTAENLRNWRTREGIGLGSPKKDVLRAYGKPSSEDKIDPKDEQYVGSLIRGYKRGDRIRQIGDMSVFYSAGVGSDDLRAAEFGIRNGKVSWISLSNSE